MPLTAGTRIGPYEITSLLGAGGMGEVYRSRDTKLKRDVAIKVLPAEFSSDSDRTARFEREAEVLATLNHPHIAQIYGFEESGGSLCLVLELVEGETLAERLKRGPIPVEEALRYSIQIAEALEAAHERSILHRDLKPANIKITPDGQVKVLDFGLAKAMTSDSPNPSVSRSPTMLSGTLPGMILGTASYMSPEQSKGREVDARSDVWAFGVVLYEMLTGKPAFGGDEVSEILAGILKAEPDWTLLPAATPVTIRSLLERCLKKDRRQRLGAIADGRFQIEEALSRPGGVELAPPRKSRERIWQTATAVAVLAALLAIASLYLRVPESDAPVTRLQLSAPLGDISSFAISPDGRKVVFQAATDGKKQLWIRPLDSEKAQPLPGTEGADFPSPFWKPDSRSIGFFANGKLKRLDIETGLTRELGNAVGFGGAWNRDGTILFAANVTGPLYAVSEQGGAVTEVTRTNPPQVTGHIFPSFLPDGRHFLFLGYGAAEHRAIYVGSLDSKEAPERLIDTDTTAVFMPPDQVFFQRQGTLVAQRLDLKTLKLVGNPTPIAQTVLVFSDILKTAVSVSTTGTVAYRTGYPERTLVWMDRSSGQQTVLVPADAADPSSIRLSPDGSTVAFIREVNRKRDVWLQAAGGSIQQFTSTADWECCPVWSPKGDQILYATDPRGVADPYAKSVDGTGVAKALRETSEDNIPLDWSHDGRFVLLNILSAATARDLWVLPRNGEGQPVPVAQTPFEERAGRFSPDDRWIAYQSNETGRDEIWLQPFPGTGSKFKLTDAGGRAPQWRDNGRELFYLSEDNHLMALPLAFDGATVRPGTATSLTLPPGSEYAVAPGGQRFLMNKVISDSAPITILQNWKPAQ